MWVRAPHSVAAEQQAGGSAHSKLALRRDEHATDADRFERRRHEGERTLEGFAARWEEINSFTNLIAPQSGSEQSGNILRAMQKVTGTGPTSARG